MRNQKGYVVGCNGQAVVTVDQVIAGAMPAQHPAGRTLLHPLLDTCREQLTEAGIRPELRTVLADSGYVSEENFARAGQDKLRLLAPLAKDPDRTSARPARRARHLDQYPATASAIHICRNDGACGPALVLCQPWVAASSLTMAARPNWRRRRLYRQSVSTLAACA
jgi:hypothetical protein